MVVRDEQSPDVAAIRDVATAAFNRPGEAGLSDRLRRDGVGPGIQEFLGARPYR